VARLTVGGSADGARLGGRPWRVDRRRGRLQLAV